MIRRVIMEIEVPSVVIVLVCLSIMEIQFNFDENLKVTAKLTMTRTLPKSFQINETNYKSYFVKQKLKNFSGFQDINFYFNLNLWTTGNGSCAVPPFENETSVICTIFNMAHYGPEVY